MEEETLRKGPWLEEEDEKLAAAVASLGERRWDALAKASELRRTGKSCRLRWMNYLRPNIKRSRITTEEELLIIELQRKWGNKWAKIAKQLPGRTDNDIKNYWRSHLRKKILREQGYNILLLLMLLITKVNVLSGCFDESVVF
nr:myb-related protein MYBAS1-like [Ipomoea batatas]